MQVKVDVLFALFCYGGNGGIASIIPQIAFWLLATQKKILADDRIGRVAIQPYGDVPLTMERNRVVRDAIENKYDIVVMLDSDNQPDLYVGHKVDAEPFWDTSFDFAFERLKRGLPSIVCAPYCGPSPHPINGGQENVYMFRFVDRMTGHGDPTFSIAQYSRAEAAQMRGIQPICAGPTGVILITTTAFDLMQFDRRPVEQILADHRVGQMSTERAARELSKHSYFFYEYDDMWQSRKASTEDCCFTREMAMAGQLKFGEPVVFGNWSSWAGHWKPWCVGMPEVMPIDAVSSIYQEAVLRHQHSNEVLKSVDFLKNQPTRPYHADRMDAAEPLDAPVPDHDLHPRMNGEVPIMARMICGQKCFSVGHVTPDADLQALTALSTNVGRLRKGAPLRMLEVGTWVGESAIALLGGAPHGSQIYCVDTWKGSPNDWTSQIAKVEPPYPWFEKNCGPLLGQTIKPVQGDSTVIAKQFTDPQELDLIFLDADHDRTCILNDLQSWYPHLAQGGVLCGHDYGTAAFPGVKDTVDQFCQLMGITIGTIGDTSVWFTVKPIPTPAPVEKPTDERIAASVGG